MMGTHAERLLEYLRINGAITPMEAWSELGIYRLGARIFDLRQAGHSITSKIVAINNRFGEACKVARYTLN